MVIVKAEFAIGRPDIRRLPIINGISIENVIAYLRGPAVIVVHLILPVQMDAAPAVKTLLRTDAYEKAGTHSILLLMQPFGKVHLELIIPHFGSVERKRLFSEAAFRHLPYPNVLQILLPRTPVTLVHRRTSRYTERHTNTIHLQYILIRLQYPVHIINGHAVLYLIVHMEYTQFTVQPVPADIVYAQIQQHSTIFSSRKRDAYRVKFPKNHIKTFLRQFIHILGCSHNYLFFFIFT